MFQPLRLAPAFVLIALLSPSASAEVTRIEIAGREAFAEGQSFGEVGPYERLVGRVYFAVDPALAANQQVVDLDRAPKDDQGQVEFSADLEILVPLDRSKAGGTLLYDVNNRGNRLALGQFNTGAEGWLMRKGAIIVCSGWIAEVLPGGGRLRLDAPIATDNGQPITSLVRAEMAPDAAAERMTITYGSNIGSHEPTAAGLASATLTWRLREADPRVPIPRDQWRLETTWMSDGGERGSLPLVELVLAGGFRPGYLYELIYEAQNPVVQGLGLAGIRDLVSYLKHDASDGNPLVVERPPASGGRQATDNIAAGKARSAAKIAIGFGVSQSGRCLRMFLYDGFNADEQGRQVFDGLIPHVAGGGLGFFNHHFASPTRHNTQHDNHLYPVDVFPFAYGDEVDPFSGRTDGLLRKARAAATVPKIMHTQTSAEYWTRSGSLVHTDPLGERDAEIPPEVRIYAIGGAQHGPGSGVAQPRSNGSLPHNPSDYRPLMRGLLAAMEDWINDGKEPPPSRYPRMSDSTLAGWREAESGWAALPGVRYPEVIQQPEFRDYGPEFFESRRITRHPPILSGTYRVCVPACGADNNEQGTLMLPSVGVPVATFTGWNLRSPAIGAESELLSLAGGYIPLPRTAAERQSTGDPRQSLMERYAGFSDYLSQYTAAIDALVKDRFLLEEDRKLLLDLAESNRPLFEAAPK